MHSWLDSNLNINVYNFVSFFVFHPMDKVTSVSNGFFRLAGVEYGTLPAGSVFK